MPKVISAPEVQSYKPMLVVCNKYSKIKDLEERINEVVHSAESGSYTNLILIFDDTFISIPEYSEKSVIFLHEKQKNSSMSILIEDECSLVDIANKESLNYTYKLTEGKITSEPKS